MGGDYTVVGSRARRLDGPEKVTGKAVYLDDMQFKGMLHGAILQSPHAHARIKSIDTSAAEALPGVKAVLTAGNVPDTKYGVSPARYDENILAIDRVRYVGDEVAAVAAVDLETAHQALELIKVEYEPLPFVLDIDQATAEGAPQLHQEYLGNLTAEVHQEFGEVARGFAESDLIRTDTFVNKRQDGGFIEPPRSVAVHDLSGNLTLYSSTQVPHYVQRTIAMLTGLSVGKVRVVKPYVGGGFGPKASASPCDILSSLLSMKTGRPVKIAMSREQVFLHCRARHQFKHVMKTGYTKDGIIKALEHTCYLEGGAYSSFGIATVYYAGSLLAAPYRLPHMKYDGYRVYTNKPACGAQRGHGGVAARACFEQQMDLVAEELGMDPIELRLKNIMETGDVSCNDLSMSSLGMKECLEAVQGGSDWNAKKGKLPPGKGIGMAAGFFVSGAGYPIYRSETFHCTVTIKVQEDGGTVLVKTAAAEIGQGSDTTMAMIAAEAIGIPLEAVRLVSGDTDYGIDLGAYSSRTTLMTGHATREAGEQVKEMILTALAGELGVERERLDIKDGVVEIKGEAVDFGPLRTKYLKEHRGWGGMPSGDKLTFTEAARMAYLKLGTIVGTGKYKPPVLGGKFKGAAVGTSPAYGCSAQVAEVTVDLETGQVTVDNITDAHDCGQAINLTSVEAQMEGSVSMGLGEAMFEEVKFDDQGRVLNPSLGEYHIPTVLDMPRMRCIVVESGEPNGPFGAKEVGEGAIMPTIPAILNAVHDATGVTITELPITPERVLMALKQKKRDE
ncbi:MAG: molybdopterin-dependent oxidoreductase [Desulfarculaceae bacterium]|nr:molybdopterin-dependent oxidoreductase [Desulfarculaceae bacterium]MCF8072038.1 molybdopterin-dependent oxidoreductase [Desulfarculaceae bacterium]MCF8101555.1 molybdopterin-dependent oxidoreductase [Desulfarculaceae bacterium]MCF8115105.1 molybdopterin-dependent oxidoreductase [Desulfarculaceae bacterium]